MEQILFSWILTLRFGQEYPLLKSTCNPDTNSQLHSSGPKIGHLIARQGAKFNNYH